MKELSTCLAEQLSSCQISLWPVQHMHTQYGSGSLFVVVIHLKQSAGHGCM